MKTTYTNQSSDNEDDLATEYTFDYTKAKPNRFATRDSNSTMTVFESREVIMPRPSHLDLDVPVSVHPAPELRLPMW